MWLLRAGRVVDAFDCFKRLRNTPLQAARDLYITQELLIKNEGLDSAQGSDYQYFLAAMVEFPRELRDLSKRVGELFTRTRNRHATEAATAVMLAQQFSGSKYSLGGSSRRLT